MAAIVGVHGIAQQFSGGYRLRTVWFDAIRDGLVGAGHRTTAAALVAADVEVAFFGDLFRPLGAMAALEPPYTSGDIRPGPEQDMLAVFFNGAVALDPCLGSPKDAMGVGTAAVKVMLDRLMRSASLARVTQRCFIGNLKQITAFLRDSAVKENVLRRVHEGIGPDTRVLIGHSLGSVVAYEYLCRYQPPAVELLLTLGSPLGIPNVVFDRLTPTPAGGLGTWPGSVAGWVNVADPDDIVALRKDLSPLFSGRSPDQVVCDRQVDNGDEPHAADRYLNARETGSALGDILG